ncbi:hypothetical protein ASPWEDRAFT_115897 [Aspergillus wentii DTO 134E9]|uniref:Zn(2)-C6 fungal-type domain-containing protein n=1 Tax=Aspergillus wentii DTO 134E9 TaxID=1073089 RepID=A0A1L9RFE0_ASPWE|nr:uncharacterized protein ASPWEDRAFT_115897 [Aspergillus wentii DTO 134E9]OJJ33588.1 hypothetical protein ASPWEDRAFT_115897 [Aspergillus wentii DTO 134E9]
MQTDRRKARRTSNACIACRHSKIKCSGNEPCNNCQRRMIHCEFAEGVNKIIVSERYLRELERQVQEHQKNNHNVPSPSLSQSDTIDTAGMPLDVAEESPPATGYARSIWTNPFTLPSTTIKNTKPNRRHWIWLAPSSTWSFTARLTIMMTEKLHNKYPDHAPVLLEREIYPLQLSRCAANDPPDTSRLPSLDHALYLFNIAKFHLGQNYQFFNEGLFVSRLREFYHGDAASIVNEDRLWFIQLLLVFAFGTAFRLGSRNKDPPGSTFFVRAMSLMPEHISLWKHSVVAIEVLALAGLYLYSIDQREAAHIYAIRIAQFEGLHTQLPDDQLGAETVTRCRNLWWTLYIMDSHFSSSVGLPTTTQDSDISTSIEPSSRCSHKEVILSLQAKLSRLLSFIMATVYKSEKTQLGVFLDTTRSILHSLAGHAEEVERMVHSRFRNSVDRTPNGTRHITLLYHQCVIVATRPLLLSVLKEWFENDSHEREDWQDFLTPTETLISIGIKSADKTLQILSEDDGLLEVFLPYDLEFTYAATLHLAIANTLFPKGNDHAYSQKAHLILDEMIAKGNKVAEVRKAELSHLEALLEQLAARAKSQGFQTLTLSNSPRAEQENHTGDGEINASVIESEALRTDALSSDIEFLNDIGISSYEFYSIVDQIANPDLPFSILDSRPSGES